MIPSKPSSFPNILGSVTLVFNFHSIQYPASSSHTPATIDFQSLSNPATISFLVYIFSTFLRYLYISFHESYYQCNLRMVWKIATAHQWSKYHHYSVQLSHMRQWSKTIKYLGILFEKRLTFSTLAAQTISRETRTQGGCLYSILNGKSLIPIKNKWCIFQLYMRSTI